MKEYKDSSLPLEQPLLEQEVEWIDVSNLNPLIVCRGRGWAELKWNGKEWKDVDCDN